MWTKYDATGSPITNTTPAEYPTQRVISSGTTDGGPATMAAGNVLCIWNSSSTGAKTQTVPTSTGSGNKLTIVDQANTAATYNITISPVSGSVLGNNLVYTNKGYQSWIDSVNGWINAQ